MRTAHVRGSGRELVLSDDQIADSMPSNQPVRCSINPVYDHIAIVPSLKKGPGTIKAHRRGGEKYHVVSVAALFDRLDYKVEPGEYELFEDNGVIYVDLK